MERTIVIYKSKNGSTARYADWIAEELGCEAVRAEDFDKNDFAKYDNIIYGGWVHAGGIMGFELIRKNMRRLQGKKLVIFAVGLNLMNQEARMQLRQINFAKRKVQGLTCYYCPGAYDPAQVRGLDSGIIKMMVKMLESKREEEMTDDDRQLLSAVKNGADLVDRSYIAPILAEFGR